jgi:hypothetical protein
VGSARPCADGASSALTCTHQTNSRHDITRDLDVPDGPPQLVLPVLSPGQKLILTGLLVLSVLATGLVLFGPARGAREDIGHVRTDLFATRQHTASTVVVSQRTLTKLAAELQTTQSSLKIQKQGLDVATSSERLAGDTAQTTESIRRQTAGAIATTTRVIAALGPLGRLRGDIDTVVESVQAGVVLARTTLDVGRQALRDGRRALAVAVSTLETLKRSERVQQDLLEVGRQTLAQVTEINRKLPVPPVFPAGQR